MVKLWSIVRNTFTQAIRQPIYGILIVVTFMLLITELSFADYTMNPGGAHAESNQGLLEDLGLSTLLMSGLFLAAFTASGVLSREIDERTAMTVISKPVSRTTFVVGKFAGVAGATTVAFYLCALAFLMTVRHRVITTPSDPFDMPVIVLGLGSIALTVLIAMAGNYLFGWSFASAAIVAGLILFSAAMGAITVIGKGWEIVPFGNGIRPELVTGIALMYLAVMLLTAVAVAASTRLGQVLTLLVCAAVFAVGSLHSYFFGSAMVKDWPVLQYVGWLLPKISYSYPPEVPSLDKAIPLDYLAYAAAYYALYISAVVAVGAALFQTRPLEASDASGTPGGVGVVAWFFRIAAIIAAGAALLMLATPRFHNTRLFVLDGCLAAAAAALWLLSGFFGRGASWAYWLTLAAAICVLSGVGVWLVSPQFRQALPQVQARQITLAAVIAAAVLLMLLLPRTRRHFQT